MQSTLKASNAYAPRTFTTARRWLVRHCATSFLRRQTRANNHGHGKTNEQNRVLETAASLAHDAGINVFAVGVGSGRGREVQDCDRNEKGFYAQCKEAHQANGWSNSLNK